MRKRARHQKVHQLCAEQEHELGIHQDKPTISRTKALQAVGEVVYAARVGELIKIGHTTNLSHRLRGIKADELLGFRPGTWDDEQQIHRELAIWAARGREWYHPSPPVVLVVNELRAFCRLEPLPYEAA